MNARAGATGGRGLRKAHAPEGERDLEPATPARSRLAYDELLANQLALGLVRNAARKSKGRPTRVSGDLADRVKSALPFSLTASQVRALEAIRADMESDGRMLRLLQGDVGSGKTVVALIAALWAVEAGRQACVMAPTEILAANTWKVSGRLARPRASKSPF